MINNSIQTLAHASMFCTSLIILEIVFYVIRFASTQTMI